MNNNRDRGTINAPRTLDLTADTNSQPTWTDYGYQYEMPGLPRLVEPAPITEAEYKRRAGAQS